MNSAFLCRSCYHVFESVCSVIVEFCRSSFFSAVAKSLYFHFHFDLSSFEPLVMFGVNFGSTFWALCFHVLNVCHYISKI